MRAIIQRVNASSVIVEGKTVGRIQKGLMVLIGFSAHDTGESIGRFCEKILTVRIFDDDEGAINRSLIDVGGSVLLVSQFTLYADCKKGRRPSFINAAPPEKAAGLYQRMIAYIEQRGIPIQTGIFGAYMEVSLVNDGPVTIFLDSESI